jgi:pimeloyl-ACP methyl ester carboxylesterase
MTEKSMLKNGGLPQIICIILGIAGITAYAMSKFISGKVIVFITAFGVLGFIVTLIFNAIKIKNIGKIIRMLAIDLLTVILGVYVILFLVIFFFQDRIANDTSSFFQPQKISEQAAQAVLSPQVEAIDLTTPDGIRLRGWLVNNSENAKSPLIIYFDGSGSETSQMIPYMQRLSGWSVALVSYRGFGLSEGTPSQSNAFADATFLYDTFSQRDDVDSAHIVAMGYSLGTGVAVYLSEQRPVAGTILVAPYDYWTLIGIKKPGIYTPLTGLMKHYFDSISRAPLIQNPLLCLIGSLDTNVPPDLSLRLVSQWGGASTVKTYQGEDHGVLMHDNASWTDIADFLQSFD